MKNLILFLTVLICSLSTAHATNLLEVYMRAQSCDAIFQQAIAQRLSTKEGVPISLSAVLPNLQLSINPYVSRTGQAGSNFDPVVTNSGTYINPRNITQRGYYSLNLLLTQTIFNFSQFFTIAQQMDLSKGADATLNAALQDLMTRVSSAYFAILQDEDNLSYAESSKLAYAEQLDQIQRQYKVGLKTLTDVYTAQASYESAVATYIQAQTTLENDRENLRVITGVYYPHLSTLSDNFPLITPQPQNIEAWVKTSILQNWSIKASRYNVASMREVINQQMSGHLPTVNVQTSFQRQLTDNINQYASFTERDGPGMTSERSIVLNVNMPLFAGGGVVALTNQAKYNYQAAQQQMEQTVRSTVNVTRQSYNSIVAGISKIKADKEAIKSTISSLQGLEASYRVGTETLVDVLNQQEKVFQAQQQYAQDRYAFVNNILALKKSAGTLSFDDLRAINAWLIDKERIVAKRKFRHGKEMA